MSMNLLDLYPSIDKPIRITFNAERADVMLMARQLLENNCRSCLLKLEHVSAPNPDGTQDITIQLEVIPEIEIVRGP